MLSVIILCHNDEELLADCIEAVKKLADELIVVDSHSTDRSPDIAKMLGAKVYPHEFKNFSDQRNFAMTKASGDWVLYLDSDEFVTPKFIKEVKEKVESPGSETVNGYFIRRKTYFYGKDWGFIDSVQRLFKRDSFKKWHGVVHETPVITGEYGEIRTPVHHYTHRNLSQMVEKTNRWSEYEAQLRYDAQHPPMSPLRFIRVMLTGFLQSYVKEKGYRNGTEGVIEAMYQAFSMFITYAKLWEKQVKK